MLVCCAWSCGICADALSRRPGNKRNRTAASCAMMKQKEKTNEYRNQAWRWRTDRACRRHSHFEGGPAGRGLWLGGRAEHRARVSPAASARTSEIAGWTEQIQKTLFRLGSALATPPESRKPQPYITAEDVEFLTQLVYQIEATEGILADWSLPGAHTESAAYEVARTVCRRAERNAVRLAESGQEVQAGGVGLSQSPL